MPNFKLSPNMRGEIRQAGSALTQKYVECMRQGFPLTAEEVQQAILEPELLATMRMLDKAKVMTINQAENIVVTLTRADLTGVTRGVIMNIETPNYRLFASKFPYSGLSSYDTFDKLARGIPALSTDLLPLEKQTQLAKWINEVVKAERLREMTNATVRRALDQLDSTGRVLANWPMLGTLSQDKDLLKKFRLVPVNLKPYYREPAFWVNDPRQVTAANVVLNTALLMETAKDDKPETSAMVLKWENLATDPTF